MGRDRAAYMREYRKRVAKAQRVIDAVRTVDMTTTPGRIEAAFDIMKAETRIVELEAEVARLKRELASRPPLALRSFGSPRPAPKPGQR